MEHWGEFILDPGKWHRAIYGKNTVFIRYRAGDWRVACMETPERPSLTPPHEWTGTLPEKMIWERWVGIDNEDMEIDSATLKVSPKLPDRSLAVRLYGVLHIPQSLRTTVFFNVPVTAGFEAMKPRKLGLGLFPTEHLSNTWIGERDKGLLGYSMWTYLTRNQTKHRSNQWHATCPLTIINQSAAELTLDRFTLNCDIIGLWLTGSRLWTDPVTFTYKGSKNQAQVAVSTQQFMSSSDSVRMSEPRNGIQSYKFGWKKIIKGKSND